jgi:hypothetical protein
MNLKLDTYCSIKRGFNITRIYIPGVKVMNCYLLDAGYSEGKGMSP